MNWVPAREAQDQSVSVPQRDSPGVPPSVGLDDTFGVPRLRGQDQRHSVVPARYPQSHGPSDRLKAGLQTEDDAIAKSLGNGTRSAADWVNEIKQVWARGTVHTLALAKIVSHARAQLRRGQWTALWKSDGMPFRKRKAEKLAAIGEHLGRLNAHTCAQLPEGRNILYQLSRLGHVMVENLVGEGVIHPGVKRKEVEVLVARIKGDGPKAARDLNLKQWLNRSKTFVEKTLRGWSEAEKRLALTGLKSLVERIEADGTTVK